MNNEEQEVASMKVRLAIVCFSLFIAGLTGQSLAAIDPATIEGLWLFEDGGGNTAKDSSGNGLNGELFDGPAWVAGKFGGGLEFDGVGSYVMIPDHANPNDAITITAWVKSSTETWNQNGWIVEKRDAYILHCNADSTNVAFPISNGAPWNQPFTWDTGAVGPDDITQWHMYTGTLDSATGAWRIYIDGELASELELNPDPIIEDVGPIYIGNDT